MKTISTIILTLILATATMAQWTPAAQNSELRIELYDTYTSHGNGSVTTWTRWWKVSKGTWVVDQKILTLIDCEDYSWNMTRAVDTRGRVIKFTPEWLFYKPGQMGYKVSEKICRDDAGSNNISNAGSNNF